MISAWRLRVIEAMSIPILMSTPTLGAKKVENLHRSILQLSCVLQEAYVAALCEAPKTGQRLF